jgi:ATP/maltotriose-dependent transcriptional regulator MalT
VRDRLDASIEYRLTLILSSGGFREDFIPALADWAEESPWPVLWLRLEPKHNEPGSFITALRDVLGGLVDLPPVAHLPPADALVDIVNGLLEAPTDFFLVLEGYDVIVSEAVHRLLARMLDYLAPQMHIVILDHTEPELPNLPRLRVRSQVLTLSLT